MERSLAAKGSGLWPDVLSVCGVGAGLVVGVGLGVDPRHLFCAGLINLKSSELAICWGVCMVKLQRYENLEYIVSLVWSPHEGCQDVVAS